MIKTPTFFLQKCRWTAPLTRCYPKLTTKLEKSRQVEANKSRVVEPIILSEMLDEDKSLSTFIMLRMIQKTNPTTHSNKEGEI